MNFPIYHPRHCRLVWCLALFVVNMVQSGAGSNLPTVKSSGFTAASQFKYRVIRSSQRASYLRCAAACLKEEDCKYFGYTKDTRRCELSDDSIVSVNEEKLKYFKRNGDSPCSVEGPLGMEDGRIPDESITASSVWRRHATNSTYYDSPRARLHTKGNAAAWCNIETEDSSWIQVDFNGTVTITGLITQGRGDYLDSWVTEYQVTYSDDAQSWDHVTDAFGTPVKFAGNSDRNTLVTARFPLALRTRILRIHPTVWNFWCCMRFEVIGCY